MEQNRWSRSLLASETVLFTYITAFALRDAEDCISTTDNSEELYHQHPTQALINSCGVSMNGEAQHVRPSFG